MGKRVQSYLVRMNRLSGWALLVLFPLLLLTGYGIAGRFRWLSKIATAELHSKIHKFLIPIATVCFAIHSIINIYFFLRRRRARRRKRAAAVEV